MRVVVTGAAGNVGRHVVAELVSRGHEVAVVDRVDRPAELAATVSSWTVGDVGDPALMAGVMASADLVVQCVTMSTIQPDELVGLRSAVQSGTGLAGWHGGIADSFRASSDYLQLVGGQFANHPGKPAAEQVGDETDNFVPYTVAMTELGRQHPITEGIADFELTTEQYWVLSDDLNDVLATTTQRVRDGDPWHREITSPAVWTRSWGAGRIFVATPGHSVDVLQDASVRTIIERGLLWASR